MRDELRELTSFTYKKEAEGFALGVEATLAYFHLPAQIEVYKSAERDCHIVKVNGLPMTKERIIQELLTFAWPEITRGPASQDWIDTMRAAQQAIGYEACFKCSGEKNVNQRQPLCTACYGTGLTKPEDWW